MRKKTLVWLSAGLLLVLLGGAIFFGALVAANFDFREFSTSEYEDRCYEITEEFVSVSILATTADIFVLPTDGTVVRVECHELQNVTHTVSVREGVLTVEEKDMRTWSEQIGITFGSQSVTIYLPEGLWRGLSVRAATSDVAVSGLSFDTIDVTLNTGDLDMKDVTCTGTVTLQATTGDVELENLTCAELVSNADTGDLTMEHVLVSGKMFIERSTGDVEFEGCDAAEICIQTSTGDVEGSLSRAKTFVIETRSGEKQIPEGTSGGPCKITTVTGDIEVEIRHNCQD